MASDILTFKELLEIIIIPITLAILAVLFPAINSWYLRRRFKRLIFRELKEIEPYPEDKGNNTHWNMHLGKRCIHREIFDNPSENRDFILSLPPDLVYFLTNLWDKKTLEDPTANQWLYYLTKLNQYFNNRLYSVSINWQKLVDEYKN